MKTNILMLSLALFVGGIFNGIHAQDMKKRKSPPKTAEGVVNGADVILNYSAPSVKDREVWGKLVPFDKVWRTGANEATTIEVSKEVRVGDKTLPAGKYSLFTIPNKDSWIVIINSEPEQWGAYKYNEEKDVIRVAVTPQKTEEHQEMMQFSVTDEGIVFHWEKLMFTLPIE